MQEQRRLFGRHLWRKYWLPPLFGRLSGFIEPLMWHWRRVDGPADEEYQVGSCLLAMV